MSTPKITPLSNRLLVRPIVEENKSELLIPDSAKEKPQKGECIEAGEEVKYCKKGDVVFYRRGSGIPMPEGLWLMREGDEVVAVIKNHFGTSNNATI